MKIKRDTLHLLALFISGSSIALNAAENPDRPVTVFVTAKSTGQHLAKAADLNFTAMPQPSEKEQCIFVDPTKKLQTVVGIGGALTDASAETFYKLPADKQQEVMRAYFDQEKGIGYSLGRTHINSCDFSSDMYTYVKEGDKELRSFDIVHDRKFRIPFIKQAL